MPDSAATASSEAMRTDLPTARLNWRGRLPFFYGWLIVAGAVISLGLSYSVWYSFSVFYVALLAEFEWSRAASAGVFSLFVMMTGFAGVGAGALADRFGPGRVVAAGGVLLAAGLLVSSRLTELWHFYVSYGLLAGAGVGVAGWTPCVTMLNRWFSARLGLALGLSSGGIGIGILAGVPSVQSIIAGAGWRAAFAVLALLVLIGLVPTGLLLLRGRPEELGQRKDGARSPLPSERKAEKADGEKGMEVVDQEWASRPWTLGLAMRTSRYWFLCTLKFVGNIAVQMIFVHQVAYLVDGGYDRMQAASVVGLIGLLSVGGKILWGWTADNIGREVTYTMGAACILAGIGLLVVTRMVDFPPLLYLYAIVFALGYAVSAPLWPAATSDLFAGPRFGSIYGFVGLFAGLGSALGSWFGGYVFDLTGSYVFAFGVAAGASVLSAAAFWIVAPRKVRRVRRRGWRGRPVADADVGQMAGSLHPDTRSAPDD